MRVVLYARVSSKSQAESDSISAQIESMKLYCKLNNYQIVDILEDVAKSASVEEEKISISIQGNDLTMRTSLNKRPNFKKLILSAHQNIFDAIVFFKWDRFSRNVIVSNLAQIYFTRNGIKLLPSNDSPEPLLRDIKSILAEDEIKKTAERVYNVRLSRFNNGMMVGKSPIGYTPIKDNNKKITSFQIHPTQGPMVKDIFHMTIQGKDYKQICKKHNIHPQTYYTILRNKIYYGIVEFDGKQKKGNHPPIINETTYTKANQKK